MISASVICSIGAPPQIRLNSRHYMLSRQRRQLTGGLSQQFQK
jgi:hypothetical protein